MFVRTERLFLRPGWPEDLDDLLEALRDEAIQRTVAVSALPQEPEQIREYLARPRDPLLPHFFMYLRDAEGARLVGGIGLGRHDGDVEMGYWVAARYRGRGFALEAVRAVIEQARALGHKRIVAKHFADNDSTVRVLEAAGFQDSGGEHLRYSEGRGGVAPAHVFTIDLERRAAPRIEVSGGQALSA